MDNLPRIFWKYRPFMEGVNQVWNWIEIKLKGRKKKKANDRQTWWIKLVEPYIIKQAEFPVIADLDLSRCSPHNLCASGTSSGPRLSED